VDVTWAEDLRCRLVLSDYSLKGQTHGLIGRCWRVTVSNRSDSKVSIVRLDLTDLMIAHLQLDFVLEQGRLWEELLRGKGGQLHTPPTDAKAWVIDERQVADFYNKMRNFTESQYESIDGSPLALPMVLDGHESKDFFVRTPVEVGPGLSQVLGLARAKNPKASNITVHQFCDRMADLGYESLLGANEVQLGQAKNPCLTFHEGKAHPEVTLEVLTGGGKKIHKELRF